MYEALYQYFLRYQELSLPGIGTFTLQTTPARGDFAARLIHPPVRSVEWSAEAKDHPAHFYPWLATLLKQPAGTVIGQFHDFCGQLKEQLQSGAKVNWKGMGVLSKGTGRTIRFTPEEWMPLEGPVTAEKVIREKAEHDVRVGEDQRTAEEMRAFLNPERTKASRWWVAALILFIPAVAFLTWQLSEKGLQPAATACSMSVTEYVQP